MNRPEECRPKCNFLDCYAGMGLAGNGNCFANGSWWLPSCPEFKDEKEWIKEMEKNNDEA